ncbi:MAG: dienelactone hydrolase family protein, partial [Gammaproteobacteria bacterium]|nr:dienelactone hydrolase family protein [Gammaproteobacteria bacterium]
IAAIGYCFGGGIVLNMARMGVDLKGVASFHGSLSSAVSEPQPIKAKIRVFNGADDPFVKAEQVDALKKEMDAADVDFRFFNYPGAKHSFTNPGANNFGEKFGLPLEYNAEADKASWDETQKFFKEIFR